MSLFLLVTIRLAQVRTDVAVLSPVESRLDVDDAVVGAVNDGGGILAHLHRNETCTGNQLQIQVEQQKKSRVVVHAVLTGPYMCIIPVASLTVMRRWRLRRQT